MAGLTPDSLAFAGWIALVVAAMAARRRFQAMVSAQENSQGLKRELAKVEERLGVMTVITLRVQGLPDLYAEDPRFAMAALTKLADPLTVLAKTFHAEVERPTPAGFRLYLGRYLPNPDHRATALDLALALREGLSRELTDWGIEAIGLGVATAEVLASPVPLGDRVEVLCSGGGVDLADRLAEAAGGGEIRVDAKRGYTDRGFQFASADIGMTLLDRDEPVLSERKPLGDCESEPNQTEDEPRSPS